MGSLGSSIDGEFLEYCEPLLIFIYKRLPNGATRAKSGPHSMEMIRFAHRATLRVRPKATTLIRFDEEDSRQYSMTSLVYYVPNINS